MHRTHFEWDEAKSESNERKHSVSFFDAQKAFWDPNRIIAEDLEHSETKKRYFCFGLVGDAVMTVRFTYRSNTIRIIGAGYWRKGRKLYEQEKNKIY